MFRGGRGAILAIGLAIVLALLASGIIYRGADRSERFYQAQAEQKAQAYHDTARVHAERRCVDVPNSEKPNCVDEQYHAAQERERNEYDLQAQLVTSVWTRAMGLAALIAMFVGIIGVGLIFVTFQETRRAATAAQKTHDAFVSVERAKLVYRTPKISFVQVGAGLRIQILVDNMGKSAALATAIRWGTGATAKYPPTKFRRHNVSKTIMPGECEDVGAISSAIDWDAEPYLTGYVEYDSAFSKGHRMHFCYSVSCRPPDKYGAAYPEIRSFKTSSAPKDT